MCDAPITIKYNPPLLDGKGGFIYTFPADCGKCLPCLKKRKQQWSFRLTEQMRESFSAYFVTLTYDDANLPWGDYAPTGTTYDHERFIKNLKFKEQQKILNKRDAISLEELNRKKNGIKTTEKYLNEDGTIGQRRKKLQYYGVLEYGDLTARPHYHYILFNVVDTANIYEAWGLGRVQIDECNVNTIDYVLKYMIKDPEEKSQEHRMKEKSFMSKGLGGFALDGELRRFIKRPEANFVINQRGHKVSLPRYYRKKFLTEEEQINKNLYISGEILKKQIEEEATDAKFGVDTGLKRHKHKKLRYDELKRRKTRKN